jgi:hypothetical protein
MRPFDGAAGAGPVQAAAREDIEIGLDVRQLLFGERLEFLRRQIAALVFLADVRVFAELADNGLQPLRRRPIGTVGLAMRQAAMLVREFRQARSIRSAERVECQSVR